MRRWSAWLVALGVIAAVACTSGGSDSDPGAGGGVGAAGTTAADAGATEARAGAAGSAGGEPGADGSSCTSPLQEPCGTFPQCGCDAGFKCDILDVTTGRTACVADGTGQAFEACASFEPCAAGALCAGGACKPFCRVDADCPEVGQTCVDVTVSVGGQEMVVPGQRVCRSGCDPRQPELSCGSGVGCTFLNDGTTDCITGGTGVGVGACPRGAIDCAPAYQCADTGMSRDCVAWCRVRSSTDCASGEICVPLTTARTFGGELYGACLPEPMLPFP